MDLERLLYCFNIEEFFSPWEICCIFGFQINVEFKEKEISTHQLL